MNSRLQEEINQIPFAYTMTELEEDLKTALKEVNKLKALNEAITQDNWKLQKALGEAVGQNQQLHAQNDVLRAANETFATRNSGADKPNPTSSGLTTTT